MSEKTYDEGYEKGKERADKGERNPHPHDLISAVYQTDGEKGEDKGYRDNKK